MDKWFKRIWVVNGAVLLVLMLVLGTLFVAANLKSEKRTVEPEKGPLVASVRDSLASQLGIEVTQDITLSLPQAIGKTDYVYVEIGVKDLYQKRQEMMGMALSEAVNILFARSDGTDPHLLVDKKAFITGIDFPAPRDSLRDFALYNIVSRDSDGDGRLTAHDHRRMYISDLVGRSLAPVLPEDVDCVSYQVTSAGTELELVVRDAAAPHERGTEQPPRLMIYDVESRQLKPFLADSAILEQARRLLQGD